VKAALAEAAAGGAGLAVFPEATMVRFGEDLAAAAEPLDGAFCSGLAAACAATGVAAVVGVFEPAPENGRVYNTAVAFSAAGQLVASYRKLHLYDALGQLESETVAPGDVPVVTSLAGADVGLQICYDIRFPELTRALAVAGARLVTVSAAWATGLFKEEHWVTLLRARAIENTVWIAAVDQVPDPDAKPTRAPTGVGRSLLIDPRWPTGAKTSSPSQALVGGHRIPEGRQRRRVARDANVVAGHVEPDDADHAVRLGAGEHVGDPLGGDAGGDANLGD
jgi:predicted amidohydrolase